MRWTRAVLWFLLAVAVLGAGAWAWAMHTTAAARVAWGIAADASGGALAAGRIEGSIAGGLQITDIVFDDPAVLVNVGRVEARVAVGVAPLSIEVVAPRLREVTVTPREGREDTGGETDVGEALRGLGLPLPVRISDLRIAGVRVLSGDKDQAIDAVLLTAEWHDRLDVQRFDIVTADAEVSINGELRLGDEPGFEVAAAATVQPALTGLAEALDIGLSAGGGLQRVAFRAETGSFATLDGEVEWADAWRLRSDIEVHGFDPASLLDDWPAGFPVSGVLHAVLDAGAVRLTGSYLVIDDTAARVDVEGGFDFATEQVDGKLRWAQLQWPLEDDQARVHSASGDVALHGHLDDWTVAGDVAVGTEAMPDGQFRLEASGTRDGARARILESRLFGGAATGMVAYNWRGERAWSADLDLAAVDVGALLPEDFGKVSGRVDGSGTTVPFTLAAELHGVTGEAYGLPLEADGGIDIRGGVFRARDLDVAHGASTVSLDGSPVDATGLAFDARIEEVGTYLADASGGVSAAGRLSLHEAAPFLALELDSDALAYGAFEVRELQIRDARDGDDFLGLDVTAAALAVAEQEFDSVTLRVAATRERQSLAADAVFRGTPVRASLNGAFDDWRQPLASAWRGRVETFGIDLGDEHALRLTQSAPLVVTTSSVDVDAFCLGDATGAGLCADANWTAAGNYGLGVDLEQVPVNVIEHLFEVPLLFEQHVSGELDWRRDVVAGTSGKGALRLSPGRIRARDSGARSMTTGVGVIEFEVQDGTLLAGRVDLPMPGSGRIKGDFALHDVVHPAESDISGRVDVDVAEIALLSELTQLADSTTGRLRGHAELSGTLAAPLVAGEVVLENASIEYLPIGLHLADVNLVGRMDSNNRVDLSGTFRAGRGRGEIATLADYGDAEAPGLRFELRGDDLTLIDVPDVFVNADVDVDIRVGGEELAINGKVLVPTARIRPTNLSAARVSESEDVVIVAGELPNAQDNAPSADGLRYSGVLDVALGDGVVVELDLARATVGGRAEFTWQGDAIPVANGRYDIAGSIEAFGQVLDITEGTVRFPKVPADSPNLRIRAEREIYGNTQVKRAGVLIDGPIRRPLIEAYTMPLTTEERALTLLVTGSDFDYEQGVGAIDFGTYIAPRLFVSYGVGVFERENIISARFDLARGFGIKASSGSKESGVDLNYRFEN